MAKKTPAVDHAAAEPQAPTILVGITDLGRARALPTAPQDAICDQVDFEPGTIEQFADEDGSTMRIVSVAGALHKMPAKAQQTSDEG